MLYIKLLQLHCRATLRTSELNSTILKKLFYLFYIISIGAAFYITGNILSKILPSIYPGNTAVSALNQFLLLGFGILIICRILFQKVTLLNITPYLNLLIRRSMLMHYFLQKSFFNIINLLSLLLLISFSFRSLDPGQGILWLIFLGAVIITTDLLVTLFRLKVSDTTGGYYIIGALLVVMVLGSIVDFSSIQTTSALIFDTAYNYLFISLSISLLIFLGIYFIVHTVLLKECYLDSAITTKQSDVVDANLWFLENKGLTALYFQQELRLLWRNRKPRLIALAAPFAPIWGLNFLVVPHLVETFPMLFFYCFLITLFSYVHYGSFMFSWDSTFWDGVLTRPMHAYNMVKAKVLVLMIFNLVTAVVSLLYIMLSYQIVYMVLALALYQIGVNVFVLLLVCTQNKYRIDLKHASFFTSQGSSNQFLMYLSALLPGLIFTGFSIVFDNVLYGIYALGGIGLFSLIFAKLWIKEIVKTLLKRKYIMAENFRK